MNERETLAPCPFCGGEAVMRTVLEHPGEWIVEWLICCHDCGIQMGAEYREDVVDAWNSRHAAVPQPTHNIVLKSGYPLQPHIDPNASDNPLDTNAPPYVARREDGWAYADGEGHEDLVEGWCLYVRADIPQPTPQPEAGWQPIETAPKDAMILGHDDGMMRLVLWDGTRWAQVGATIEVGWFQPTHWRPIPTLPGEAPQPAPDPVVEAARDDRVRRLVLFCAQVAADYACCDHNDMDHANVMRAVEDDPEMWSAARDFLAALARTEALYAQPE